MTENRVYSSPFSGMSRREAIRKAGFASMIALPVVYSLIAPNAAMAQSLASKKAIGENCGASPEVCASNCCITVCFPSADCL